MKLDVPAWFYTKKKQNHRPFESYPDNVLLYEENKIESKIMYLEEEEKKEIDFKTTYKPGQGRHIEIKKVKV